MRRSVALASSLLLAACTPEGGTRPDFGYPLDDVLRVNHLQMKGTHNSYHLRPEKPAVPDWDYEHVTLTRQLEEQGVRQFELDVHWKAEERRFEVYHLTGLDDRTTCLAFKDCLQELLAWSNAHPGHHPLFVFVEPKDDLPDQPPDIIYGHYDDLDAEVLAVWPRERIITPDDIKGTRSTLAEAIRTDGWPTLGESRGKIVFTFLDTDREPGQHHYEYTHGNKDLNGRVMFVVSKIDDPYAAVLSLQDPVRDDEATRQAVAQNFLVRTMSDDSIEARQQGKRTELDAALAGAAHMISTDYPVDGIIPGYFLDLAGGTPSRCKPVSAPAVCTSDALESPERLTPRK